MKDKILEMLYLQDSMNAKVNPVWKAEKNAWCRAMWLECAEMMEHIGWKWWKKQEPNLAQVHLEIVDIWHFVLSIFAENSKPEDYPQQAKAISIAMSSVDHLDVLKQPQALIDAIEYFVKNLLTNQRPDLYVFTDLMRYSGLTFDQLHKMYIGKNVLNFFRQDNGYKEGTYIKDWLGKEDNEHLTIIINALDSNSPTFAADIKSTLELRYKSVFEAAADQK